MKEAIEKIVEGKDLSREEAERAMELLLTGQASQAQIGAFLTALRMKGETFDEILGFASVLREKASRITPKLDNYVDLVGTGGDCSYSFNISTTAAFVCAGAGLPVAKHGNRSISSKSGAGDVLEALGVNIMASPEVVEHCVESAGIGFMFAPLFNQSMKHVGQARKELGIRTVFNILGPLSNPSRAKKMVVGVYSATLTEVLAKVLAELGVQRGLVVSGLDNMDEITITTKTVVSEIINGKVETYEIAPEDFGIEKAALAEIQGGDGTANAVITRAVLKGKEHGPKRDIVLMNAGATLYIGGLADSMKEGIALAAETIDAGKAYEVLEKLEKESN